MTLTLRGRKDAMDDHALWEAFTSSTLAAVAWTHQAHLRVAWLFLKRHPVDEAHLLMRVGIIRLNASHALVETPQRGYHETMTRLWIAIVRSLMTDDAEDSEAFVERHAARSGKDAPLRHYTRERLLGVTARAIFVEPDVAPLPF